MNFDFADILLEVIKASVVAPSGRDIAALDRAVATALLPKLGRS